MSSDDQKPFTDSGTSNERQVIDPITHLPLTVHDYLDVDIERIPPTLFTDDDNSGSRSQQDLAAETDRHHAKVSKLVEQEISQGFWRNAPAEENRARMGKAMVAGTAAAVGSIVTRLVGRYTNHSVTAGLLSAGIMATSTFVLFIFFEPRWFKPPRPESSERHKHVSKSTSQFGQDDNPESANWLNSFLKSVWPIIDPALFTSIGDLLEDSLTATLPKGINAVRVADIGQGSEPIRILGIRWLKAGEASVAKEGMAAEEGDFINLEAAVAFRSDRTTEQSGKRGLKSRQRNPHLLIQFFTVGGIRMPVWVEVAALLATVRMRIQLTPNPPFLSLATITFLGQPKVSMSCVPLVRHFLNIMDVPGLSRWMQSAIDGVIESYVAPRSISLDLKAILSGREKMDTDAVGVFVITVKSAEGFRDGDGVKFWESQEKRFGDGYVTVGWGKWGKDLWSSRIIQDEPNPKWEETCTLLVSDTEINAQENLRLQLWDSDRTTADDLLGTVQIPLKDLLQDDSIQNTRVVRTDKFTEPNGSSCPGTLTWEVGYFSKTTFEQHLAHKPDMNPVEIKQQITEQAGKKLREALPLGLASQTGELEQQKREDLKERTDEIIANTSPTEEWPGGILRITIEQVTGLEIRATRESGVGDKVEYEEDESDDLPSPYCTVIINHQILYRTRTKLKTTKPFFAATTERYIKDWRDTTVIICAKDSRLHETDPILGVVDLPLRELFSSKSQVTGLFPLSGGIASGRARLSFTYRSLQVQLPKQLLGWDVGTLDIEASATASDDLPLDLAACQLIFRTLYGKGKMNPDAEKGGWSQKRSKPIRLAVKDRYSSCLLIQFRKKHRHGVDSNEGFCTLWLKDIPDEETLEMDLAVHRNTGAIVRKARMNAADEYGEKVGTLKLRLRLWSGLSGYHERLAKRDTRLKAVMEALDCARDARAAQESEDEGLDSEDADSSSSSEEDEEEGSEGKKRSSGLMGEVKSYKERRGELHRKHRGLMQWSPARNVAWVAHGVEEHAKGMGDRVKGLSKHRRGDAAIEREV